MVCSMYMSFTCLCDFIYLLLKTFHPLRKKLYWNAIFSIGFRKSNCSENLLWQIYFFKILISIIVRERKKTFYTSLFKFIYISCYYAWHNSPENYFNWVNNHNNICISFLYITLFTHWFWVLLINPLYRVSVHSQRWPMANF